MTYDLKYITVPTACGTLKLPDVAGDDDLTDKLRITWHWSAGSYDVNNTCLSHYHIMAGRDGRIIHGVPIERQFVTNRYRRHSGYAQHVRNGNANNIGLSVLAMAGSHEHLARRGNYGPYPITIEQVEFLVEVTSHLCAIYGIPVLPTRVLGHAEWRTVLGIHQDRWDVGCIPHLDIRPRVLADGTWESHNYLRRQVEQRLTTLARPTINPREWEPVIEEITPRLRHLYEAVGKLPLSVGDQQRATAGLNQFNRVLVDADLKPESS